MKNNKGRTYPGRNNKKQGSSFRQRPGMTRPVDFPRDDSDSIPLIKFFDGSDKAIAEKIKDEYYSQSKSIILIKELSLFAAFLSFYYSAPLIILEDNKRFAEKICKSKLEKVIIEEEFYNKYIRQLACEKEFYPFDFLSIEKEEGKKTNKGKENIEKLFYFYSKGQISKKDNIKLSEIYDDFIKTINIDTSNHQKISREVNNDFLMLSNEVILLNEGEEALLYLALGPCLNKKIPMYLLEDRESLKGLKDLIKDKEIRKVVILGNCSQKFKNLLHTLKI